MDWNPVAYVGLFLLKNKVNYLGTQTVFCMFGGHWNKNRYF